MIVLRFQQLLTHGKEVCYACHTLLNNLRLINCIIYLTVTEGIHLRNSNIDPYSGDLFHETPVGLLAFAYIHKYLSSWTINILFVITDMFTAWFLYATARHYVQEVVKSLKKFSIIFLIILFNKFRRI